MTVTLPIVFRDGGLADIEVSRCAEGSKVIRISVPDRAAYVDIIGEKPVLWADISPDELFLPEEWFSDKLLKMLGVL